MSDVADRLEARADRLAADSLNAMYADPFWQERFGDIGRRFAEEDSRHHVTYLVEALRAESPETLAGYARWLQSVLTTRGLCTIQIADHFEQLRRAIAAAGLGDTDPAGDYLTAAQAALRYPTGPGRAVQDSAGALAEAVVRRVAGALPVWVAENSDRCRDDVRSLLSYLADAVALGRPELFAGQARWLAGFYQRYPRPAGYLNSLLRAGLVEAASLPPATRDVAAAVLEAGLAGLEADA